MENTAKQLMIVYPNWYMYIIAGGAMLGGVVSYVLDIKFALVFFIVVSSWYIYKLSIRLDVYEDKIVLTYFVGIKKVARYEEFGFCFYSISPFSKLKINKREKYLVRIDYQYINYMKFVNLLWEKKVLSLWSIQGMKAAAEIKKDKR